MARVDIRLPDDQKDALHTLAFAEGKTISEFIRNRLITAEQEEAKRMGALREILTDYERRLSRLEEMAGL